MTSALANQYKYGIMTVGFGWLIHVTATSGYCWFFSLIALDASFLVSKPCLTPVGIISLLENSPQATGAALPSLAYCPWELITSLPTPSGP